LNKQSAEIDKVLRLADQLLEKPLSWTQPASAEPSNFPVLRFVLFRAFSRAVAQYNSLLLLLKTGQWEDAVILGRSLYELNVNLSKVCGDPDPEAAAKRFVKFGKCQLIRLDQRDITDRLRDARESQDASGIAAYEKKLADISAKLDQDFGEFRTAKGKWQDSWSGANVNELAQDIAEDTGGKEGESDYFVYKLGSLFTHNSPGSLFLTLPPDRETLSWSDFRAAIDKAGWEGLREFLHEASLCLVDIVGMSGGCIAGYQREWFDEFALQLLEKL
jgi:hypothetical protein